MYLSTQKSKLKLNRKRRIQLLFGLLLLYWSYGLSVSCFCGERKVYLTSDDHISAVVTKDMDDILAEHDVAKMKRLAANKATFKLLKLTTKNSKATEPSGYQGEDQNIASYNTVIKNKTVDVDIVQTGKYNWKIKRIEAQ